MDLRLSLIQKELFWEMPDANRAEFEEIIQGLVGVADLIILPEMFTTGFTMNAEKLAEPMNLHTQKWMRQMAKLSGAAICGSVVIKESGNFYNRFLWVEPYGGNEYVYDKKHLFSLAGEHEVYTAGTEAQIIEYKGFKIKPQICYDLRFPEWSRNTFSHETGLEYDLLLYVANWPAVRIEAWDTLLRARAIENQCYVAGVNRLGKDGNGISYCGHSAVFEPQGTRIQYSILEEVLNVKLSLETLLKYRDSFPAYKDQA